MHDDWFSCPNCGADVAMNAASCPECGSDENTGWKDGHGRFDPDPGIDGFDYDEFVENEFGEKKSKSGCGAAVLIALLGVLGVLCVV
jgi:hypothetical protein